MLNRAQQPESELGQNGSGGGVDVRGAERNGVKLNQPSEPPCVVRRRLEVLEPLPVPCLVLWRFLC